MSEITVTSSIDELRFRLQAGVHEPGDAYYEDTCTLFNVVPRNRRAAGRGDSGARVQTFAGAGDAPHLTHPGDFVARFQPEEALT